MIITSQKTSNEIFAFRSPEYEDRRTSTVVLQGDSGRPCQIADRSTRTSHSALDADGSKLFAIE